MTYEEQRAAESAADSTEPILQRQEWRKDHKYRALMLEPVIDRNKALKKAKLLKQIRKSPLEPEVPYDVGDEETLEGGDTKPATHAGYLNGLVYRLQKDPTDKDTLAELLYEVHDDAALEIYPGKFAEGYTVNESWTAEDTAKVIESAQRIAAEPLSNCVWPDDSDHTIEAAALRAQGRRLAGMPEEMIEELAWQHEHPEPEPDWWLAIEAGPTAQEPAATEPKPNTKLCCAVDHGPGCASRIYHGTDCPGAESCPVKQYEDERWKQEDAEMEAALCGNREPAAQEPATATGPELGYLMTLIERLEDADDEKDELDAANELFYVMYSDQPEKEIDVGQLLKDAIRLVNKLAEGDRAARADEPDDVDYFAVFGESVGRGLGMTEKTEPAAQEPAPVPGTAERAAQETADPDALHFHSLAEYKAWAAGVSTQECHAYWDALSDFDWRCLWDDLDDEAAAQEPATKAEERC